MTANPAEKNLAAEVRGVEEGHKVFAQPGGHYSVVSDTHHQKSYRVDALPTPAGHPIPFLCQPEGNKAYTDDHRVKSDGAGVTGCKHAALVARRLEREGKASFDGTRWKATKAIKPVKVEHVGKVITKAEGARSNFGVVCSCGYDAAIATTNRQHAEEDLTRHTNAFNRKIDLDSLFG